MAEVRTPGKTPSSAPDAASSSAPSKLKPSKRSRPNKPIPTERIKFDRQLDLLRAFASVHAATGRPVTNKDVADMVEMSETTTSLANSFFTETGLLNKGTGGWIPADEVVAYNRAYEWNKDTAARELQPVLARTWFWETLQAKLGFRPLEERDAINALGAASAASGEYRQNLKLTLDYLVAAGFIERDGTLLKIIRDGAPSSERAAKEDATSVSPNERTARNSSTVNTGFSQHPGGAVQFHINVDVSMSELAGWTPDRITAFFSGMAKVIAAKSGLEKDVTE